MSQRRITLAVPNLPAARAHGCPTLSELESWARDDRHGAHTVPRLEG